MQIRPRSLQTLVQQDKEALVRTYKLIAAPLAMIGSSSLFFSKYHSTMEACRWEWLHHIIRNAMSIPCPIPHIARCAPKNKVTVSGHIFDLQQA